MVTNYKQLQELIKKYGNLPLNQALELEKVSANANTK